MKQKQLLFIIILFVIILQSCNNNTIYESEIDSKVDSLVSKMSLEEKVGQMTQITLKVFGKGGKPDKRPEPFEFDTLILNKAFKKYKIGSVLNTVNSKARDVEWWKKNIDKLQELAMAEIGIPLLYGIDAIHGVNYTSGATLFPQQIGQAATFNPELVRKLNELSAYEMRASNIPWTFSPVQDMGRDPRDPRFWETFGEDVYLCQKMGEAAVIGLQGDNDTIIGKTHGASCLKHFLAYNSNSGKDRNPLEISVRELKERHAASFQQAIDAGAKSIMISSGIINSLPVHANYEILTQLLRNEMGFKGLLVTDWADIENLKNRDKVAKTQKEAVKLAINAGVDMSMVPNNFKFCDYLVELVNEGEVPISRIDDAVKHILKLKYELGLFDKPTTDFNDYPDFGSEVYAKTAYQGALESITLLKNDADILPLSKNTRVLISGPNSNSMRSLNGGWSYSWQGEKTAEFTLQYNTFLEAITNKIGKDNVVFVEGVSYKPKGEYYEEENIDIDAAVEAANNVDIILLFLGENSYCEKKGDLNDLYISKNQSDLAVALANTNKPVILVLNEGRPRLISKFESQMRAVIQTYLPGNYGGDALADIVFGDENPQGKLPYTYPKYPNSLRNYDCKPSQDKNPLVSLYDNHKGDDIQYKFGWGLSYSKYEYSNLKLSSEYLSPEGEIEISINVKNTGKLKGSEVVMLYTSDSYASITPDIKRLRRFKKISLDSGETKTLKFKIKPIDLAFYNYENQLIAEKGEFIVQIDELNKKFKLKENVKFGKPSLLKL